MDEPKIKRGCCLVVLLSGSNIFSCFGWQLHPRKNDYFSRSKGRGREKKNMKPRIYESAAGFWRSKELFSNLVFVEEKCRGPGERQSSGREGHSGRGSTENVRLIFFSIRVHLAWFAIKCLHTNWWELEKKSNFLNDFEEKEKNFSRRRNLLKKIETIKHSSFVNATVYSKTWESHS